MSHMRCCLAAQPRTCTGLHTSRHTDREAAEQKKHVLRAAIFAAPAVVGASSFSVQLQQKYELYLTRGRALSVSHKATHVAMGILFSQLWRRISGFREVKICMIGLDAAGKTTILYKMHLGEIVSTYPTIGSNVEEVTYRNMRFQVWDLGGQDMLRQTWRTYFINTHALIMVVDSADPKRLDLARKELHAVLDSDELRESCLLVFANKQDLKDALSPAELSEALSLHTIKSHDWHIQACSATKGEGLYEGLEWISKHVQQD